MVDDGMLCYMVDLLRLPGLLLLLLLLESLPPCAQAPLQDSTPSDGPSLPPPLPEWPLGVLRCGLAIPQGVGMRRASLAYFRTRLARKKARKEATRAKEQIQATFSFSRSRSLRRILRELPPLPF